MNFVADRITKRSSLPVRHAINFLFTIFAAAAYTAGPASAQDISDLKRPKTPLVLKERGSFFVGGQTAFSSDLGRGISGHHRVNQMYVDYMRPLSENKVPVVLIHGGGLTGKTYGTTPDGRIGWDEHFVRAGFATYVPDQLGRGKSGFDPSIENSVKQGLSSPSLLDWRKPASEYVWPAFRNGPTLGTAWPNTQFPTKYYDQFLDSSVPDKSNPYGMLLTTSRTIDNLAMLGESLKGAVLVGHSQSGRSPLDVALLNPKAVAGAVVTEPGGCRGGSVDVALPTPEGLYSNQQIRQLARTTPVLVLFGDLLGHEGWSRRFNDCKILVDRLKSAGGNATMLYLPDVGITGTTHMFMIDKNNLEVADLIIKWIRKNVKDGKRN